MRSMIRRVRPAYPPPMSYCRISQGHPWHGPYHDREYGFPIRSDAALLERLALEINQAGLSWLTMLVKRENFRKAFEGFDPEVVAAYGAREFRRLMQDAGIIRNRLKISAVIENAKRILAIRESHGSFAKWLDAHHPLLGEGVAEALQEDLRLHRRRDRRVVPACRPATCAARTCRAARSTRRRRRRSRRGCGRRTQFPVGVPSWGRACEADASPARRPSIQRKSPCEGHRAVGWHDLRPRRGARWIA